jgi:hypothetical protein
MTQPKDDKDFDNYLKGQSPLSERYAESAHQDEEPADHVDQRILQAARQAAEAPSSARRRAEQRWYVPTSIAAVLVLSFILVLYYRHQPPPISEYNKPPDAVGSETAAPAPRAGLAEPKEQTRQRKSETAADTAGKSKLLKEPPAVEGTNKILDKSAPLTPAPHVGAESDQATTTERPNGEGLASPEQWLAHIQALIDQDNPQQARAQFKAFSKHYPNYNLEGFPDIERLAASLSEQR